MNWQEAVKESKKAIAMRIVKEKNGFKTIFIRYYDGSGYRLISRNGKIESRLSRVAFNHEINGFMDWQPS